MGTDFEVDGVPVSFGDLETTTGALSGTLCSGETIRDIPFFGNGTITLVSDCEPPTGIPVLPKRGWILLALLLLGSTAWIIQGTLRGEHP